MDTRILDLIKNPETIKVEDINLLETEIEKLPYMQSLRAIYLLGIHRFYNDRFPKELTKTAAYTTDKRILYNFINKVKKENASNTVQKDSVITKEEVLTNFPKVEKQEGKIIPEPQQSVQEPISIPQIETPIKTKEEKALTSGENQSISDYSTPLYRPEAPKPSITKEELLATFPMLEPLKETPKEVESAIEEAVANIGEEQTEIEEVKETISETAQYDTLPDEEEHFTEEKQILVETKNEEQEPESIETEAENNTTEPVSQYPHYTHQNVQPTYQPPTVNEGVTENYILAQKANAVSQTPIDFYTKKSVSPTLQSTEKEETKEEKHSAMDFYASPKKVETPEQTITEKSAYIYDKPQSSFSEKHEDGTWHPMDFYTSKPTPTKAEKQTEETPPKQEIQPKEIIIDNESIEENTLVESQEDLEDLQLLAKHVTQEASQEPEKQEITKKNSRIQSQNSNVSSFINTWKSWLKIDTVPSAIVVSEQDRKAAIIDRFIENNPKISPIKEETDFVVKERGDDISHLMTETLASLYLEQKLYSKAINAYKILQEKYPERTEEFEATIQEIKKSRNK